MELLIFVIFLSVFSTESVIGLSVLLNVTDYAGVQRVQEPVTSGVPLPESAGITSINQLKITDSNGIAVPAQFKVLSRWGGTPDDSTKPVKWVLIDFQADVPKDGSSVYYLKEGTSIDFSGITSHETSSEINLDTGVIKIKISKDAGNLFESVVVNGKEFIIPSQQNGAEIIDSTVTKIRDDVNAGDTVIKVLSTSYYNLGDEFEIYPSREKYIITNINGNEFSFTPALLSDHFKDETVSRIPDSNPVFLSSLDRPSEVVIEESGPLRTVIKVRGSFKDSNGEYIGQFNDYDAGFEQPYPWVGYNIRIHAYKNKDYVRIFYTFENNGAGDGGGETIRFSHQWLYFDSLSLDSNLDLGTSKTISSEGYSESYDDQKFSLYQGWKDDDGFIIKKDDSVRLTGSDTTGWVDIDDGNYGVTLDIRHFWENYPKEIVLDDTQVELRLWPEGGFAHDGGINETYRFLGGRHKTHEILYRFYHDSDLSEKQNIIKGFENPLFAQASPEWYIGTEALGMAVPAGMTHPNSEIDEAMDRYDRLQLAVVYPEYNDRGESGTLIGHAHNYYGWEPEEWYGWLNFGDIMWAKKYDGIIYDWPYIMQLHFLRTGKKGLFDLGEVMARHRYDIDQYHGNRTYTGGGENYQKYLQRYESGIHGDSDYGGRLTHTWNGGLLLYYLLTGDRKALEAAEENGRAVLNYFGPDPLFGCRSSEPTCCGHEIRAEGWSILNLINLYRTTGKQVYIQWALNIGKNRLLYTEQQQGGEGFWGWGQSTCEGDNWGGCNLCLNEQQTTMYSYISEPLINLHYETQDPELRELLIRMADFSKNIFLWGGFTNSTTGEYMPLQTGADQLQVIANPRGGEPPLKAVWQADLLAYAYLLTDDIEYLNLARQVFRDSNFYYTVHGDTFIDPSFRSPITYNEGMYGSTSNKAHGMLGRTNQIYLYAEQELQEQGLEDCESIGGVCKDNSCSGYTDCTSLAGICSIGYCCQGSCEAASSCESGADEDNSGEISMDELLAFIEGWKMGTKSINRVLEAIGEWKSGC